MVIMMNCADSSRFFIEGYIIIIGIFEQSLILLIILFTLLITYNHSFPSFAEGKA